jgi:hypothetical protein
MKKLIDDFRIFPGAHCGSVAMRGLLRHYTGLDLPEPVVFGLGAGPACGFLQSPSGSPAVVLFGRHAELELDVARHLQIDYRERTEEDDDEAWRVVREEVIAGRPTMLCGDIFYLDYRDFTVNFPAHRFVLLGFDDEAEQVFIADRINDTPETCSLSAVRISRNAPTPMSDQNRWGRFHDASVGRSLRDAAEAAIRKCARAMLEEGPTHAGSGADDDASANDASRMGVASFGLSGARAYAESLRGLHDHPEATATAKFNASCLEKFGNGGGNFRRLYAGFLEWARALDPGLVPAGASKRAIEAADAWTAASAALFRASDRPGEAAPWLEAADHVDRAAGVEHTLFRALADHVG